jgi:hypothetical protein
MSPVAIFARDEFAANLRKQMGPAECAVAVNTYTHHKELEKLVYTIIKMIYLFSIIARR